ncbi:MAG TPA: sugar ABC transporter permease [Spirochaetia bacterium]|nr:sugar ABC transporter permease [Spirochaetia bacterium]
MADHRSIKKALVVASFLLPSFVGFFVFVLLPVVSTIGLSFTNYSGGRTFRLIGIANYLSAFRSTAFLSSLWITARFVVFSVFFQLALAFVFAIMLNGKVLARTFFRGLYFLPSILSSIAIGLAFALVLNPGEGPVNMLLKSLGMAGQPWLTSTKTALGTIIFVSVWQSFGYYMVLFLAGLQSINPSLYESADLDGAGLFRKLLSITIPMLTPTTFFCVTTAVIKGFQVFDLVYIMTGGQQGGGPDGSTTVLVFDIYRNAFMSFRMGYASAEATVLLLLLLVVTTIQYRSQRGWVSYDAA